jgi:tetratricopeptide (TPR) repeat protein
MSAPMFKAPGILALLSLFLTPPSWAQAAAAKPATPSTDHSQEALVVEQSLEKEKFENDGTSSTENSARIRIQSQAGVQQYGVISFSYASGTGSFQIDYVRVRKPDGSVVETPPDNVQDMAADITRAAPFYSDLHEKHVAVKGLGVGDVLEFRVETHVTKPLAPGQFWTAYHFGSEQIVLDEELEISVPHDRAVKFKSARVQPAITEVGAYRVYTWHSSNLQHKDPSADKRAVTEQTWQQARGRQPEPDVMLSSFASWADVGHWYGELQEDRVRPSPEIVAKAAELTRNAADDDAKMRILYAYVSTQFHYIGIAFGIGRYQPHSAAEVLSNQYGDCKDKHTLLASLLTAAGIPAYPALISSTQEVEADVPSPGQFNHVITIVPRPGGPVWLDTTAEVGPYQYLVPPIRGKHALAVWKDKPAELLVTPATLPFGETQTFNMNAKLSDAGTLEGQADFSVRGDTELVLRSAFRQVPLPQWRELGQRISQGSGFGGEVSDVTAGAPEKTDEPFHVAYKYTRKDFGDWPNRRIVAPSPIMMLFAPADDEMLPLGPSWLGPSLDLDYKSQLELPSGYTPDAPAAIHLKQDFAQYDSTYSFKDGKLITERRLRTFMEEVPAKEREEYKKFIKTVLDDYGVFIPLAQKEAGNGSDNNGSESAGSENEMERLAAGLKNLPDSTNPDALRLAHEAGDAINKHDAQSAVSSLYRSVAADPKFARAWITLGGMLMVQKQKDAAMDAFRKAIAVDPTQITVAKAVGFSLMTAGQYEDAIPIWQDFEKAHPEDSAGPANLGFCFLRLKRYPDAIAAYDGAIKIAGDKPHWQAAIGTAYLSSGDRDKAGAAFGSLGSLATDENTFNDVAYQMANADLQLPVALDYAQRAVRSVEQESQKITLPDLKVEDVNHIFRLAAYWDTLGWADERLSNLEPAEQYLQAAWKLTQNGVVAGHLCHLYQRIHKNQLAIEMCRLAVYRIPSTPGLALSEYKSESDEAQATLDQLTGGNKDKSKSLNEATDEVIRERTFKLGRLVSGNESAEFFVLLASDGKSKAFRVEDVRFISGSDKMKTQDKQLKNITFNFTAPDQVPARFVRRGILGCYEYGGCSFVLLDPAPAHSLN